MIVLSSVIVIVMLSCGVYTLYINQQRKEEIAKLQPPASVVMGNPRNFPDPLYSTQPSVGAISIISGHLGPAMNYRTSSTTLPGQRRQNAPLPPTPSVDSIYASIDEVHDDDQKISPLSKRSMSLMSMDQVANPQEVAASPYDIPKTSASVYNKPRRTSANHHKQASTGKRLMRAISRKMSMKPSFRRALSSDQLDAQFASTRNMLLKHRRELRREIKEDVDPSE